MGRFVYDVGGNGFQRFTVGGFFGLKVSRRQQQQPLFTEFGLFCTSADLVLEGGEVSRVFFVINH